MHSRAFAVLFSGIGLTCFAWLPALAAGPVLSVEVTNGVPAGEIYADAPIEVRAERAQERTKRVVGVSAEIGSGDKSTALARGAVIWHWDRIFYARGNWELAGYWELALGSWESDAEAAVFTEINDIGFTPMFVWRRSTPVRGVVPFLEAGIGVHYIDETMIADRDFSTEFQFGDAIGAGFIICMESMDLELGYRFQHLSNAGIEIPNDGMEFNVVRVAVHF